MREIMCFRLTSIYWCHISHSSHGRRKLDLFSVTFFILCRNGKNMSQNVNWYDNKYNNISKFILKLLWYAKYKITKYLYKHTSSCYTNKIRMVFKLLFQFSHFICCIMYLYMTHNFLSISFTIWPFEKIWEYILLIIC